MSKIGIQCQEKDGAVYLYNRELKPIVIKSINILDPDHYVRLAAENPGVELVYRQVPNGPWRDDPEGDGRRWAGHLYGLVGHIPQITLVEGHNEWIHAPPHNTLDDLDRADRFMAALIDKVHELWGGRVHAIVLNASCGHFSEDIVSFFPRTLAKLQKCGKCLLGLHEYDHPSKDMRGDGLHYLCGKFLRNLAALREAGYDKVRIAITECGVDSGAGTPAGSGHVGFKYWEENAAVRYLNERNLGWYIPLVQKEEGIAWLTIFGCGMHGEWGTFDIKNTPVPDGIGEIIKNWSPNGGESMVEIYDFDNSPFDTNPTTRDWPWLRSIFGPDLRIHDIEDKEGVELQPGDIIYKVQWLDCKVGETGLGIHVEGVDGAPEQGKYPIFGWPTAEDHGLPNQWGHWTQHGTYGPTNEHGDVGPGMGTGAYYDWTKIDPETGKLGRGPHFVWVWDLPSDYVDGIGMLTWHPDVEGNHLHVNIGYKAEVHEEEEPPPPPPDEEVLVEIKKIKAKLGKVNRQLDEIIELLKKSPPPPPVSPFWGEYFNNVDLSGTPVLVREEAVPASGKALDFDWGTGSPAPEIDSNEFSVRWTAERAFEAGDHHFHVSADDGVRLWVDDVLLIDQWHDQAETPYEAIVTLAAGQHSIRMDYYERAGRAVAKLWWT